MSTLRPVLREILDTALTLGAIAGALTLIALLGGALFGLRPVVITSGSMAPAIPTGAVAWAQTVPADEVRVGDVAVVQTATGSRVTHRVVDVVPRDRGAAILRLQGDANRAPDPTPYPAEQVGRVVADVPLAGHLLLFVRSPVGALALGALAALLITCALRDHARDDSKRPRRGGGGRRRTGRTAAAAGAAAVLATASPANAAPWTDDVAVSGTTLTAAVIGSPTLSCQSLGLLSLRFNWTAVAGATSYRLVYNNGNNSLDTTATSATVGSLISNGSAWVVARRDFGATTWTSVPSNTVGYTVALVALCN